MNYRYNYEQFSKDEQHAIDQIRNKIQSIQKNGVLNFGYTYSEYYDCYCAKYIMSFCLNDFNSLYDWIKSSCQINYMLSHESSMKIWNFCKERHYFLPTFDENQVNKFDNKSCVYIYNGTKFKIYLVKGNCGL